MQIRGAQQQYKAMTLIMKLLVSFSVLLSITSCQGVVTAQVLGDTLQQGELMNATNSLISSQKKFSMRFFDAYWGRYLGIYYNNIQSDPNPLWVGNRNTPVNITSVLSVESESGHLLVSSDRGTTDSPPVVVLYNSSMGFNRTATLLDTGNLVLRQGGVVLWQSFDHPTDTLLPEMKVGFNHRTGSAWSLTSWMNENDPSVGAFTLEWDSREKGLVVNFRGKVHWTSGKLRNHTFENMVPSAGYKYMNHSDVENQDYFSYTEDAHLSMPDSPGWKLAYNGNIYQHASEERVIASVDNCYGFNTKESKSTSSVNCITGCELFEQPKCRNAMQKFVAQTGFFTGSTDIKFFTSDHVTGYSDCKAKCWEDCDCVGFMTNEETECIFSRGSTNTRFHKDGNSNKIYTLTTDSITSPSHKKRNTDTGIVISVLVFYVGLVLFLGILRDRWKNTVEGKDNQIQELLDDMDRCSELERHNINDVRFFCFKSIAVATRNFSPDNKLGEGGFGPVYKGEFCQGKEIAVKKLSRKSKQGISELRNELTLVANLQHTNLVRMLGCCIHRAEKMLIYDYMPNKSLDLFLFDESKKAQLTWERRFSIIEGIAQGLLYLHKYSRLKIIHRDLKAANILLDQNMNPKISDFGLARIFMQNLPEANTSRVVGTYGYMAPEYATEGIFSVKSDVYSFGVLILEILSGRKNKSFYDVEVPYNLVAFVWELWNRNAAFELMDPSLADSCIQNQFLRCVHVGLLCVENCPRDRPTMDDVVSMLANDISADLPFPKRPANYYGSMSSPHERKQNDTSQNISENGMTITTMEAR